MDFNYWFIPHLVAQEKEDRLFQVLQIDQNRNIEAHADVHFSWHYGPSIPRGFAM
jgi:hypothetical protein